MQSAKPRQATIVSIVGAPQSGRSLCARCVSHSLVHSGATVLLVDANESNALARSYGLNDSDIRRLDAANSTLLRCITTPSMPLEAAIMPGNPALIAAGTPAAPLEFAPQGYVEDEIRLNALRVLLEPLRNRADYIVIDAPAGIEMAALMSMRAADVILICCLHDERAWSAAAVYVQCVLVQRGWMYWPRGQECAIGVLPFERDVAPASVYDGHRIFRFARGVCADSCVLEVLPPIGAWRLGPPRAEQDRHVPSEHATLYERAVAFARSYRAQRLAQTPWLH